MASSRSPTFEAGPRSACIPHTWASAPCRPSQKLFERTGLTWDDVDLVELNEAFAAQVLAVLREWDLPTLDGLNVNGSGVSLGHPIAATGARVLATMLYEAKRRNAKIALETMCVGGGQGVAAAFELAA